ncbi:MULTISPECIES: hypothetical protein [Streptomyces]|uniref:hypothetical protein n=1 Tax=Streptomyces TaxID=1883 RepID=UPI0015862551|nr:MULTISPECIES: hypothetical protein [unclassified Streptomyces]MBH0242563.1 hypothetical protein [Streptomyces cavourensis]NUV42038.1 hypothetical protein [Streptomyces sp. CAI-24]NUV89499.1 hypothetical protein [Streptomyces sp. KAI-26]NUW23722.1 hypothetical protein [Streptomyces roseoviolaceus]
MTEQQGVSQDHKPSRPRFATFKSIRAAQPAWDSYDSTRDGFRPMPGMYAVSRRPNWWGAGATPEELHQLAKDSGIPVSWVAPAHVLRHLLDTGDHDARLGVLVDHQDEIRMLCKEMAEYCDDEWLGDAPEMAAKVVAAWGDGHPETAACMALLAVEELAHQVSRVDRSKKHKGLQDVAKAVVSNDDWFPQGQTVLSPLFPLYAQYWAHKGHEVPEQLSRHALVHSISLGHLSKGHAIVAIMLMISLLRELQERCDEVRDGMHANDPEVE